MQATRTAATSLAGEWAGGTRDNVALTPSVAGQIRCRVGTVPCRGRVVGSNRLSPCMHVRINRPPPVARSWRPRGSGARGAVVTC